jgi:hypothetical protein
MVHFLRGGQNPQPPFQDSYYNFVSLLRNPDPISKIFDDACITTLINIARIGILARLNEMLSMFGLLRYRKYAPQPNIEGAKKQTIG